MNLEDDFEEISKIEAARRQLKQAIRMFFSRADGISTHTLVAAAHQVLMDLSKSKGIKTDEFVLFDPKNIVIREERQKEWADTIRKPQNFFKHGNSDPLSSIRFNPKISYIWIFDCVRMYGQLDGEKIKEFTIFYVWFQLKHSEYFYDERIKAAAASAKHQGLDIEDFDMLISAIDDKNFKVS